MYRGILSQEVREGKADYHRLVCLCVLGGSAGQMARNPPHREEPRRTFIRYTLLLQCTSFHFLFRSQHNLCMFPTTPILEQTGESTSLVRPRTQGPSETAANCENSILHSSAGQSPRKQRELLLSPMAADPTSHAPAYSRRPVLSCFQGLWFRGRRDTGNAVLGFQWHGGGLLEEQGNVNHFSAIIHSYPPNWSLVLILKVLSHCSPSCLIAPSKGSIFCYQHDLGSPGHSSLFSSAEGEPSAATHLILREGNWHMY